MSLMDQRYSATKKLRCAYNIHVMCYNMLLLHSTKNSFLRLLLSAFQCCTLIAETLKKGPSYRDVAELMFDDCSRLYLLVIFHICFAG